MKTVELREKSKTELTGELPKLRLELSEFARKHRTEGLKDMSVLRKKRWEIARLMTVIREKEILSKSKIKYQRPKTQIKGPKTLLNFGLCF